MSDVVSWMERVGLRCWRSHARMAAGLGRLESVM